MSAPQTLPPINHPVPFEEFKLFYESTERVTDRRLELTKTNSSLSTLVIAGLGVAGGWGYREASVMPVVLGVAIIISRLGFLFCIWWEKQIETYKDLNGAKFAVLEQMAAHIAFSSTSGLGVKSARPFVREWAELNKNKQLQVYKKGFALESTDSELIVPRSFRAFFQLIGAGAAFYEFYLLAKMLHTILIAG